VEFMVEIPHKGVYRTRTMETPLVRLRRTRDLHGPPAPAGLRRKALKPFLLSSRRSVSGRSEPTKHSCLFRERQPFVLSVQKLFSKSILRLDADLSKRWI